MLKRARHQDGFIREVLWLALVVVIVAVIVLDAMSLVNARRSVEDSAATAAREARNYYYQTQDVASAEDAAKSYLQKNSKDFVAFETSRSLDGSLVFNVSASGHAETYVFKYLGYVGLRDWVDKGVHPSTTQSSI